jgi:hypothetical protein
MSRTPCSLKSVARLSGAIMVMIMAGGNNGADYEGMFEFIRIEQQFF